ncbi:MAG: HAD family hydrolase [Oscillospiraceae bacterium]
MDYSKIALFSDLDGTLFDDSTQVQKRNLEALRRFTEAGGLFCVSSGRTPDNAAQYLQETPINGPSIFYNGAAAYSIAEKRYVLTHSLDSAALSPLLKKLLAEQPAINIQVYNTEAICFISPGSWPTNGLSASISPACSVLWRRCAIRGLRSCWRVRRSSFADQELVNEAARGVASVVYSSPQYLELLPLGVSKNRPFGSLLPDRSFRAGSSPPSETTTTMWSCFAPRM